jgi:hypothetical protein
MAWCHPHLTDRSLTVAARSRSGSEAEVDPLYKKAAVRCKYQYGSRRQRQRSVATQLRELTPLALPSYNGVNSISKEAE